MKKSQVKQYLRTHELDIQSAVASYVALSVAFESYVDAYGDTGFDYNPCFSHFESSHSRKPYFHQIVDRKQIEKNSDKLFEDYIKDPKSLDKFIENHQKSGEKAFTIWEDYQKNSEKNKEILRKRLSEFLKAVGLFWSYALAGEDKGEVINRRVVPELAKLRKISLNEAKEIVQVLAHPDEPAVFNLERKAFLNLCLIFLESKIRVEKEIEEYLKKYFWFKTDFHSNKRFDRGVVINEIKKEISDKSKEEIEEEKRKIDEIFLKIKKEKEELLGKIELGEKEKKLIDFSQKISFWIDQRKQWMMEQFFCLFRFVEETSKILKVPYEEIAFCSREEIIDCIEKGQGLERHILNLRRGEFFLAFERGKKEKFFFGGDARNIFNVVLKKSGQEIKGTIASVGDQEIVSGRARVVTYVEKGRFEKDEILVTSMTRVEFVPLMKKAKAVITDEGGMVCHAAIVSRELGLPAIIGTRNATKRIKNGDQIEMNMKTGEIKIIN